MTDERIIAYLLGELPEDEMERFEDECFAQEEWPDEVAAVEDDLIEAYLRGHLTPSQHQGFERNYLVTPARQERVAMAVALLRCIDEHEATPEPADTVSPHESSGPERFRAFWGRMSWPAWGVTAVTAIMLIAGAFWLISSRTPSPRTVATLALTLSHSNRAGGAQADRVKLAPDTEAVSVSLALPQPAPPAARYRVELENANGDRRSVEVAEEDAQAVRVVIPASQLARGQYALKLFALGADGTEQRISGSYFFVVE